MMMLAEEDPPRTSKVLVCGAHRCGKSWLMERLLSGETPKQYKQTMGVDIYRKEAVDDGSEAILLEFWCCTGQERYRPIVQQFYENVQLMVLCFDMTRADSFEELAYWHNEHRRAMSQAALLLVGCKNDQLERIAISAQDAGQQAAAWGVPLVLTSARTGDGVESMLRQVVGLVASR